MKVAISTIGKFSSFYIARELLKRNMLAGVYTAYPKFKLKGEGIPDNLLHSFPYVQTPYMVRRKLGLKSEKLGQDWAHFAHTSLDWWVSKRLPPCDIFIGLSGGALNSGRVAKKKGMVYVCHRGSADIRYQSDILVEEYAKFGITFDPVDPRTIEREAQEYELADIITCPSQYARRTFIERGLPAEKVFCVNYGAPTERFSKTGEPDPDTFEILFVGGASIRKGVPYLLKAFELFDHPRKVLRFAGAITNEAEPMIKEYQAKGLKIETLGHIPQLELKHVMSKHHTLVLPSIEDGFPHVVVQAMSCGCPTIVSENVGAADAITDGENGFIVPIRSPEAIAEKLQTYAANPELRREFGERAMAHMQSLGGWTKFGEAYVSLLESTLAKR